MDEMKNENTKKANQAWRKKPRKFAPKSRLGCKTCKIRRVKCDLARPSCLKCQSTGRTCDGYGEVPFALKAERESSHRHDGRLNKAEGCDSYHPCTTTMQNLAPFMILPPTGSAQTEAMGFFEYISIKHLNEHHPCEPWRKTLMFFSQTVPSVRHAAIALALTHRDYLDRNSIDRIHHPHFSTEAPLFHYNRAIQLLLNQEARDSTETTAVTLLVCYLFVCFDHLAGNYVQAMSHLRGGVELSRNIDKAMLTSGAGTLIEQVTRQIRRLDMQAVTFLIDWTPADIQDTLMSQSQLLLPDGAFWSLDQAADRLQILVAQVMRRYHTEQQIFPTGSTMPPPSSSLIINSLLGQLETWARLFEAMLQKQGLTTHKTDPGSYHPRISLLRLQHDIIWILLSASSAPGREMAYDNFLSQFQQCVALASEVAAAHERYSEKPTFTPEVGILPVLYIIGVKCRHPVVRREVLGILRRQSIREAVWDSISAARVVERVIEMEEGGSEGMERSADQIAVWQRVETMSWLQVVSGQGVARVDITYTFCGREGAHVESLML